jgi:hypothetical protein
MAAFVYKRRTALDFTLRLLDFAIANDSYESVLAALGTGIREAAKRIENAGDEEAVADYETEIIENMLGDAVGGLFSRFAIAVGYVMHGVWDLSDCLSGSSLAGLSITCIADSRRACSREPRPPDNAFRVCRSYRD